MHFAFCADNPLRYQRTSHYTWENISFYTDACNAVEGLLKPFTYKQEKVQNTNGYFNEVMYYQKIDSEFKWIKKKQLCSDFILWYEQIINAELSNITLPL